MAVKIAGGSDVCFNGCSFIMEYTRIMELVPSKRLHSPVLAVLVCGDDTPTRFGAMGL